MYDYLIVGGGIAGCTLYNRLKFFDNQTGNKLGKVSDLKVKIIDYSPQNSSSKVAAGIYNPIVFKRLSKSWEIDNLLPEMELFYSEMENIFDTKLLHKVNIAKILANQDEVNFWQKKAQERELSDYLSNIKFRYNEDIIENSAGLAVIKNSGFLDINNYINHTIELAKKNDEYLNAEFDFRNLEVNDNIKYKIQAGNSTNAEKLIFAEGYKISPNNVPQNPFFPHSKFKLTKGEVLTIKIENFDLDYIINKGVFLLPLKEVISINENLNARNLFRIGATYEWNDLTENQTDKGKNDILNKFKMFFKGDFEIIEHKVGIRPTVIDRRPIIGVSPSNDNVFIFNGLGTKGVMIAPLVSKVFINNFLIDKLESLSNNMNILNDSNYNRFMK